jgi:hypothetical protein
VKATQFTLTRVGAGPGVALFSCEQLLGAEVKVVDIADYKKAITILTAITRLAERSAVEIDGEWGECLGLDGLLQDCKLDKEIMAARELLEDER